MSLFKPTKPPVAHTHKVSTSGTAPDLRFEPLPQPEVVESDSDTSWAMWEDSVQSQNPEYDARADQDTVPMPLVEASLDKKPVR